MPRVNVALDDYDPIDNHVRTTDLSSAVTLIKPAGAKYLVIQALTQNVVIAFDGTTATANNGQVIIANDTHVWPIKRSSVSIIEAAASAETRHIWLG